MVKQCSVIFGCLAVGEFISWILNIPVPGSILGMLLLTFLLDEKVINVNSVKGIAADSYRNKHKYSAGTYRDRSRTSIADTPEAKRCRTIIRKERHF